MYSSHYKTNKQLPTKSKCIFMLFFSSNLSKEACGEHYGGRFMGLWGCKCLLLSLWALKAAICPRVRTRNQDPKPTPMCIVPTSTISICAIGQQFSQPMRVLMASNHKHPENTCLGFLWQLMDESWASLNHNLLHLLKRQNKPPLLKVIVSSEFTGSWGD